MPLEKLRERIARTTAASKNRRKKKKTSETNKFFPYHVVLGLERSSVSLTRRLVNGDVEVGRALRGVACRQRIDGGLLAKKACTVVVFVIDDDTEEVHALHYGDKQQQQATQDQGGDFCARAADY